MKSLTTYIYENSQESLQDFMINEGLFGWLKKFWNWLWGDTKENVEKNNGVYTNSEYIQTFYGDPKYGNKKSQQDFEKIMKNKNAKYVFIEYEKKSFGELLKDTKSTKNNGTFFNAYVHANKHPEQNIMFAIGIQAEKHMDILGFAFLVKGEEDNQLVIVATSWSNQLTISDDKEKYLLEKLIEYIHSVKEYKKFKNITIDLDYDTTKKPEKKGSKKDDASKDDKKKKKDNKKDDKEDNKKDDKKDNKDDTKEDKPNKVEVEGEPETKLDKETEKPHHKPDKEDDLDVSLKRLLEAEKRSQDEYTEQLRLAKKDYHRALDKAQSKRERRTAEINFESERAKLLNTFELKLNSIFERYIAVIGDKDAEFKTKIIEFDKKADEAKQEYRKNVDARNAKYDEENKNVDINSEEGLKIYDTYKKDIDAMYHDYKDKLKSILNERNDLVKDTMKRLEDAAEKSNTNTNDEESK